jgi:hypothetical protein
MDVKGTSQHLGDRAARQRSAAFPFDLPYRLINMFSVKGDAVVDPFFGLGTTMWAAMAAARNCVGYEIEAGLRDEIYAISTSLVSYANKCINRRIQTHINYIKQNQGPKGAFKYTNQHYQFAVKTRQETDIFINPITTIEMAGNHGFKVSYSTELPQSF